MSDTQFDDEILDSNAISPTDEEGNPVPVTIPIALRLVSLSSTPRAWAG